MTRYEARIRAQRRRKRVRRRRRLLALLFAGVLFAPKFIQVFYTPPEPAGYETPSIPGDSVSRPPMLLSHEDPGLSVQELIDPERRPSEPRDSDLLGDQPQGILLKQEGVVGAPSALMQRIFDDQLDQEAFDQAELPFDSSLPAIPEPQPGLLMLLGLLGLALAGRRRDRARD